jgi:hypothetical protein
MKEQIENWFQKWNEKDLNGVMELFHDEIVFENWNSIRFTGKESLRTMLNLWFSNDPDFFFLIEDILFDPGDEKMSVQWLLTWPSVENGFKGLTEKRRGVDKIHFQDKKINKKNTYSKTTVDINGRKKILKP